jgi:hypothetical protein
LLQKAVNPDQRNTKDPRRIEVEMHSFLAFAFSHLHLLAITRGINGLNRVRHPFQIGDDGFTRSAGSNPKPEFSALSRSADCYPFCVLPSIQQRTFSIHESCERVADKASGTHHPLSMRRSFHGAGTIFVGGKVPSAA